MTSTLEKDVKYLDEQYRFGNALISDSAFDQLERNLLRTDPNCGYFNSKTRIFLPSISKNDYKGFLKTLLKKTRLTIQPKIDGCPIALNYINGKLEKGINRTGIDVTSKIKQIKSIPCNISVKRNFQVRGELYYSNQTPTISQRTSCKYIAGKEEFKEDFSFCCFEILNGRLNQYETLNYLKKCGFNTPHSFFTNFTSEVECFRKKWLKGELFSNYPTDGIIIKINSRKLQFLRETSFSKYKDWQYAIKG